MGVHKLTTSDLESLGRWKSKSKDPNHCPEYMVRTARNKKRKKSDKKTVDVLDVQELVSRHSFFIQENGFPNNELHSVGDRWSTQCHKTFLKLCF